MGYRVSAFILGLIIGGYWLRVLRMARKARKNSGRAANFLPPEPVGRLLRLLWIPIVLVWIVHPFITSLAHPAGGLLAPLIASGWLAWPAVALAGICFWLTRICWRAMGKSWRMGIDPTERTALVIAGPYRYVRHPIYALSQLMMLASAAAIPSPLMIAAALLHVLLLQWEARREEAHLISIHGQDYREYCLRIGRFIPAVARVPYPGG